MPAVREGLMKVRTGLISGTGIAGLIVTAALAGGGPASATMLPGTTFVSPAGSSAQHDHSCASAAFSSVQAAVTGTRPGGTVVVCKGVYHESVTVTKRLILAGRRGAVIDAAGQPYAIGLAHTHDVVRGMAH